MAGSIGMGVTLRGIIFPESGITVNLASGITRTHVGRAVSWDSSGPNKVKLAGDGDTVLGSLFQVEDRKQEGVLVGTVRLDGGFFFPIKAGATVTVGQSVVGAGSGEVKAAGANVPRNQVVEIVGSNAVVFMH